MSALLKLLKSNLDCMTIGLLIGCAVIYMVTDPSTCSYEQQLDC